MEGNIFSIEILSQGKYESWEFKDEAARDELFKKIMDLFREHAITEKGDEVDDASILQLSATSLKVKEDGNVDQQVPYEWYDAKQFGALLDFINNEYPKYE
ncbi:hypothetical protein DHX103_00685 [Planococcus sp. X10-3]|uniref:hypothetical protein n=1 Tax=Planococcus sp. X10-3 TaxID=3061240 RepID=UPI003BAF18DD